MKLGAALAAAVVVMLPLAASAQPTTLEKLAGQAQGYVGGVIAYEIRFSGSAENVIIHDPLPDSNHQLLTVGFMGETIDCTRVSGGMFATTIVVTCDFGPNHELQIALGTASSGRFTVRYRVRAAGTSTNVATVTAPPPASIPAPAVASTPIVEPYYPVTKIGPATAQPGDTVSYTITVTNPAQLGNYLIHDQLTTPLSFRSVTVGGQVFTASGTTPGGDAVVVSGNTVDVRPATTVSPYTFLLTALLDPGTPVGSNFTNAVTTTGPTGATITAYASSMVTNLPPPLRFSKQVSPGHARIGDLVAYTIAATPSAPQSGPIVISDPLDPALELVSVRVNGQLAPCGATPASVGPVLVACNRGRPVELTLPEGSRLVEPLSLEIDARVRQSAGVQVPNTATLTAPAGGVVRASAPLTVDNAGAVALILTAGRVLAQKGDLVPFTALVAVPSGAPALIDPVLRLRPSRGLRIGDVRVTGPDGASLPVQPSENQGALLVTLGPLASGTEVVVTPRARVGVRSQVGVETLTAELWDGATRLDGRQARIQIVAEPEFDLGTVLGEVFRDDNGDGVRQRGEPGVWGAQVVMDDGLTAVSDSDGRFHLAAVVPGERALKLARHSLPPGARFTTDETRVVKISPGGLVKIDFGVQVPLPEPPAARLTVPRAPAELRASGDRLLYRLSGATQPGATIAVDGRPAHVEPAGSWSLEVPLSPGRNRLALVTTHPDGRVVISAMDVFWVKRSSGGDLVLPRRDQPRLTLQFPPGAPAESAFTLEGRLTAPVERLKVAGTPLTAGAEGRVTLHLKLSEGGAGIPVEVVFADGLQANFVHSLGAGADFMFLVGVAEGKLAYVDRKGAAGSSGLHAEGRVKLYAKGRILGRYLLDGGLDIDSEQLASVRDLVRGDPQRVFRNLDPNRFYTVYGDASQTSQPPNTRARLYVRIRVDRSELRFGNFDTGLTGVELGRYARAVTGGKLTFVRASGDPAAPPTTQVILFGAWLTTARAHDELRGTGGSLYYLSHRSLVEGSEQVRVEVRERLSDRPVVNADKRAALDYEIDYLAGRVMLREPLASSGATEAVVRSSNLDGDRAFLIVDYEYVVAGDVDEGSAGARATQRLGPVRLGATAVNEFRSGTGYTLLGGDVQLDLKQHGVVIGEYAHSYGSLTSFARSDDGGLTYASALDAGVPAARRDGGAWKAEADLHAGGVHFRPYARAIDQSYTDTAHAQDAGFWQVGGQLEANLFDGKLSLHYDERHFDQASYDPAGLPVLDARGRPVVLSQVRRDAGGEVGRRFRWFEIRLGARAERVTDALPARAGHRATIGARLDVPVGAKLVLYTAGQLAVEHGGGSGLEARDNSLVAVGAKLKLPAETRLTVEGSHGAQGEGGLARVESRLGPGRVLYGSYTLSQDRDDRLVQNLAAGGRERITDAAGNARATLYAEDQFRNGPADIVGRAHVQTAGVDVPLSKKLLFGGGFERGTITPSGTPFAGAPPLERNAGTVYASYAGDRVRAQIKGELRSDERSSGGTATSATSILAWVISGMATVKPHPDLTVRGKLLWAQATGAQPGQLRSTEATIGFAWRPSFTDRLALLGRYTYLDEGVPSAQAASGPLDPASTQPLTFRERSHVMSIAGEGRVWWRISLGGKIAAKRREEPDAGTGNWMVLWLARLSLHVTRAWDAVAELRILAQLARASERGVALEVNRILVGHLRLGVGWNFTSITDDELQLGRGREHGFFMRAQGFY